MKQSVLVVRRFKNRNGAFSWRVQGTLNGVRIRRNFKSPEEAAADKAALEVSAAQLNSNLRSMFVAKFRSIGEASLQAATPRRSFGNTT